MIEQTAVYAGGVVYTIAPPGRHDKCLKLALSHLHGMNCQVIAGFLTDDNRFMNRAEASTHAFECGQIEEDEGCLISEMIWPFNWETME